MDPWILVKQCSRSDGRAIQPILASPGQSGTQGHPQQPKWTSKGMPSTLQWHTNGQQLAIHRIIETSYHRTLSLGAGGRGRSPSDSPHPFRGAGRAEYFLQNLQSLSLEEPRPPPPAPQKTCLKVIRNLYFLTLKKHEKETFKITKVATVKGLQGPWELTLEQLE